MKRLAGKLLGKALRFLGTVVVDELKKELEKKR